MNLGIYFKVFFIPLFWSLGTIIAKYLSIEIGADMANNLRFSELLLFLTPLYFAKKIPFPEKKYWMLILTSSGALYGSLLTLSMALCHTKVANAVFYGTFYCLFIPTIKFIFGTRYEKKIFLLMIVVLASAAQLTGFYEQMSKGESWHSLYFNQGDFLALLSAFLYSIYVLVVEHFNNKISKSSYLGWWQITTMGLIGLAMLLAIDAPMGFHSISGHSTNALLIFFIFTLIWSLMTGLTYIIQNDVQKQMTAALIGFFMILDFPITVVLGVIVYGESIPLRMVVGGAFLMIGIFLSPRLVVEKPIDKNLEADYSS